MGGFLPLKRYRVVEEVKVLIVEDEMLIADTIADALTSFGYGVLEPEINFTNAIKAIENEKPDIGIFDIKLSGKKSGVDLAKYVQEHYKFPFIFLTSNSDKLTLNEAKLTEPAAFLIKPFNNQELFAAIELALHNYSIQKERQNKAINTLLNKSIFIKDKDGFNRVDLEDIIYVKSDNIYVEVRTKSDQNYIVRATLNEYQEKLNENFLRVHRSYIINLEYLERIEHANLIINSIKVPIGIKYKKGLMNYINKG